MNWIMYGFQHVVEAADYSLERHQSGETTLIMNSSNPFVSIRRHTEIARSSASGAIVHVVWIESIHFDWLRPVAAVSDPMSRPEGTRDTDRRCGLFITPAFFRTSRIPPSSKSGRSCFFAESFSCHCRYAARQRVL